MINKEEDIFLISPSDKEFCELVCHVVYEHNIGILDNLTTEFLYTLSKIFN
jgi:hypothetical protein